MTWATFYLICFMVGVTLTALMQQQLTIEAVKVKQVEKEQQVKVEEAEIKRRSNELVATVLKEAEVER